jgi:hypothetical protein
MTRAVFGWPLGIALAAAGAGCSAQAAATPLEEEGEDEMLGHPSGGFLEHARSSLVPFCEGVLVASDVVISSSRCVEEGFWELSFGVGEVGGATIPVDDALVHPLASVDPRHALVALVLSRPVRGVVPAAVAVPEEPPCGTELPSYQVALRGDPAPRYLWTACALEQSDDVLIAMDGFPNCHGDSGAGAFDPTRGDDRVIGWVTAAGHLGPPHPIDDICVTDVELASVAENLEFLDRALALSRYPTAR